ncbi:MAG: hypothetical protein R3322_08870 [Kiloniellales bacterium]|jgi:hypothetical protein|nr:hypothetical protein [Kiloniellales bacterium]
MPYVARDKDGAIIAVFKEETECAREHLNPLNDELRRFVGQKTVAEEIRELQRLQLQARRIA